MCGDRGGGGRAARPYLPGRTGVRYGLVMVTGTRTAASEVSPGARVLPRRDAEARARLHAVAARTQPFVAAGDRRLPVGGPIGALLPAGGVQRGSTIAVGGAPGSGSTTVALTLAAAATSAGEWAAIVDPAGSWGGARSERAPRGKRASSSTGSRSCGARPPTVGARWSRRCSTGSRWWSPRCRPVSASVTPAAWSRTPASGARCWWRWATGRWRPPCACTPVRVRGAGSSAGSGLLEARDLNVSVEVKGRGFAQAG